MNKNLVPFLSHPHLTVLVALAGCDGAVPRLPVFHPKQQQASSIASTESELYCGGLILGN